jgi:hypothetical protein
MELYKFNLSECSDRLSAINTFNKYGGAVYDSLRSEWNQDCPIPCQQTSYAYTLKQFHINSWLNPGEINLQY